jgi:hypothetical protein
MPRPGKLDIEQTDVFLSGCRSGRVVRTAPTGPSLELQKDANMTRELRFCNPSPAPGSAHQTSSTDWPAPRIVFLSSGSTAASSRLDDPRVRQIGNPSEIHQRHSSLIFDGTLIAASSAHNMADYKIVIHRGGLPALNRPLVVAQRDRTLPMQQRFKNPLQNKPMRNSAYHREREQEFPNVTT